MKRNLRLGVVLLLAAIMLAGCTGGSSLVDKAATGSIVFHLTKGEEQAVSALSALPDPTHIRVRISHANGYKVIRDIAVPQSEAVEIPVPAIAGYRVDAVSYIRDWTKISYSDHHLLLKYDTELGINVSPNSTTMVQLVLEPFAPEIILPDEVVANKPFEVTISNVPDFMHSYATISLQMEPHIRNIWLSEGDSFRLTKLSGLKRSGTNKINAPDSTIDGDMYFHAMFHLPEDMMLSGEYRFHFAHWINNIDLGEPQISIPLKLPEGGIGIGIEY